jgi:hypothetical protein
LSCSITPAGPTATCPNPITISSGAVTATLPVQTATSTTAQNYTVTVQGTSASLATLSHSATATLVVQDFSLAATPASQSINAGSSATYTVTVTPLNGFSGTVSCALSGLPPGAGASFNPASISGGGGSSTLTITTTSSTPAGDYTLTITCTSGSLSHSVSVVLSVKNFVLTLSPASQTVTAGSTATYTITVTPQNGFTGTVTFASVSGVPSGVTASPNPPNSITITSGAASGPLNLVTSASASGGTFTVSSSGPISHSVSGSLSIITIIRPNTFQAGSGSNLWSNTSNAFDGDLGTFASPFYAAGGNFATGTWSGFSAAGIVGTPTAITLKVSSSASILSNSGNLTGMAYSLDGSNSTWIYYLSSDNCFGVPVCSNASSRSQQTDAISLPLSQNVANVSVLGDWIGNNSNRLSVFEVWIEITH